MSSDVRRLPGTWHIEYEYSIGEKAIEFFERLEEGVILGARCSECDRVYVPPKGFCEHCFRRIEDLVELGDEGTIEAVTIVTAPFPGSPEVPYCVAYVRLDGATSSIANFVKGERFGDTGQVPASVAVGAPVKVLFAEERQGRITDFWFEPAS